MNKYTQNFGIFILKEFLTYSNTKKANEGSKKMRYASKVNGPISKTGIKIATSGKTKTKPYNKYNLTKFSI